MAHSEPQEPGPLDSVGGHRVSPMEREDWLALGHVEVPATLQEDD
jgi:hypothetical protein